MTCSGCAAHLSGRGVPALGDHPERSEGACPERSEGAAPATGNRNLLPVTPGKACPLWSGVQLLLASAAVANDCITR